MVFSKRTMCEGCGLKVPSHGLESERRRRWCVGCGRAKGALSLRRYCEHCGLKQFAGCPCRPGCGKTSPCAAGLGTGLQSLKCMRRAGLGPGIDIFCDLLHSVPLSSAIPGLGFSALALPRPQVHRPARPRA